MLSKSFFQITKGMSSRRKGDSFLSDKFKKCYTNLFITLSLWKIAVSLNFIHFYCVLTESSSNRRRSSPNNALPPSRARKFDPRTIENIQIPDGIEIRYKQQIIGKINGHFILPYAINWCIILIKEPTGHEVNFQVEPIDDEAWLLLVAAWARKEGKGSWVNYSAGETIVVLHMKRIRQNQLTRGNPENLEDEEANQEQPFVIVETFELPGLRFSHIKVPTERSQPHKSISARFIHNVEQLLRSGGSQSNRF